jgi:putative nucleotidyltransferase with HDIG domain
MKGEDQMNIDELLTRMKALPPLSQNCFRLEELLEDSNATPNDLAEVLMSDMGLTAKILNLANSAFLAIPGGVDSVVRAVTFLGFSTIHQMVLCLESYRILGEQSVAQPDWLSSHSRCVAAVSSYLEDGLDQPLEHGSFSAALLHDVGRLTAFVLFPEQFKVLLKAEKDPDVDVLELENHYLGLDHQQIGFHLAKHWKFPESLRWVISDHHGPGNKPADVSQEQAQRTADLVAVADYWSWFLKRPGLISVDKKSVHQSRLDRLNLLDRPSDAERDKLKLLIEQAPNL